MVQITEKELSALSDLLTAEQLAVAKYKAVAEMTQDAAIKDCYTRMAQKHQRHFDELYTNLK